MLMMMMNDAARECVVGAGSACGAAATNQSDGLNAIIVAAAAAPADTPSRSSAEAPLPSSESRTRLTMSKTARTAKATMPKVPF
jgi:hypothetical protein